MHTPAAVRFNYPTVIAIFIFAIAAFAMPLRSVNSGSLIVTQRSSDSKSHSDAKSSLFGRWGNLSSRGSLAAIFPAMPVTETIGTYAADCTTPKTAFYLGETVCAKTDGVTATDRFVNWLTPSTVVFSSSPTITTNPQTFVLQLPTDPSNVGSWKATIADPTDSSINPAVFTVTEAPPVATYDGTCTNPKTSFALGETVCVKTTGLGVNTSFPNKIAWSDPEGLIHSRTDLTTDPQSDTFTLPSSSSSLVFGGITVDNRGTWVVSTTRNNGRRLISIPFTVTDPAQAVADVFVQKFVRDIDASGGLLVVLLVVENGGPNAATNVNLADSTPVGSTLTSFTQQSGPACSPAGTGNCTIASLSNGDRAEFTAIYNTGSIPAGVHFTSASVSASQTDSDSDNNSSTVQFSITTAGGGSGCSLACPTSISFPNDPGTGFHVMPASQLPQPTTSGTCGAVSTTATPNQSGNYVFPVGTSVITASSESGETCQFSVTINDVENPTISCPANITAFETSEGSGSAIVNFAPTVQDNSGTAGVVCDRPSGSSFDVGSTTVTCHAVDDAGNTSADCTFTVTVNPVSAGCTLTPPAPVVVDSDANACGAQVTFEVGTSATGCGTVTCDRPSGSFFPTGSTLVTCTSSPDGASTSFTVTVNDATAPVPNLATLPTLTGDCIITAGVPTVIQTPSGPKTVVELPTATDNCGGTISASTADPRTYDQPGSYTVTWTYTDGNGNSSTQTQIVNVTGADTEAPVPDLVTLPTITDECSATVPNAPTATDNCGGTLTGTTTDPLTYTGVGTYTVRWTYTDSAGHSVQQNQTVVVTDVHAPTIALAGPSAVTVECHTSFDDPGVTTTDNCVPKNVTVQTTGAFDINTPGVYTLTYTATDAGNNQASVQRTVTVEDKIAPSISCPANIVVYLPLNSTATSMPVSFAPTATDSCDANVPVTTSQASGSEFPVGTTTVTASATDDSGNSASCTFTVTVLYNFTGFFSPINNPPTFNNVNAGRAIPIKFSLSGNKGLNIFAAGYPVSQQIACDTSAPISDVEGTITTGGSTLTYSPDQYHYNWKTEVVWFGTCRVLTVKLNDGSEHTALFKFK